MYIYILYKYKVKYFTLGTSTADIDLKIEQNKCSTGVLQMGH